MSISFSLFFFFFNDTATTEIYTLSLHDALPILAMVADRNGYPGPKHVLELTAELQLTPEQQTAMEKLFARSEEHTSELQSRLHLVCRLLLEKKTRAAHIHCTPAYVTNDAYSVIS